MNTSARVHRDLAIGAQAKNEVWWGLREASMLGVPSNPVGSSSLASAFPLLPPHYPSPSTISSQAWGCGWRRTPWQERSSTSKKPRMRGGGDRDGTTQYCRASTKTCPTLDAGVTQGEGLLTQMQPGWHLQQHLSEHCEVWYSAQVSLAFVGMWQSFCLFN